MARRTEPRSGFSPLLRPRTEYCPAVNHGRGCGGWSGGSGTSRAHRSDRRVHDRCVVLDRLHCHSPRAYAIVTTMTAVGADTATRLHPSTRSRVGDGGLAATNTAVTSPGAEAANTDGSSRPAIVMMPISTLASAATANVAGRVAVTAPGSRRRAHAVRPRVPQASSW